MNGQREYLHMEADVRVVLCRTKHVSDLEIRDATAEDAITLGRLYGEAYFELMDQLVAGVSAGTGAGTLTCINYAIPPFIPVLRDHLFLLVTVGLPVFLFSVWLLLRFLGYHLSKEKP